MIKKLSYKLWPKIVAFLLLLIFTASSVFSLLSFYVALRNGYYSPSTSWQEISDKKQEENYQDLMESDSRSLLYAYLDLGGDLNFLKQAFGVKEIKAYFEIFIGDTKLEGTYSPAVKTVDQHTFVFYTNTSDKHAINIYEEQTGLESEMNVDGQVTVEFTVMLYPTEKYAERVEEQKYYTAYNSLWIHEILYHNRFGVLVLMAISIVALVFLSSFLAVSSGRKENFEGVYVNWFSKIPIDLFCLGYFFANLIVADRFYYYSTAFILAVSYLMFIPFALSICVRLKAGKWWENSVIYKFKGALVKLVKFTWLNTFAPSSALPVVLKAVIVLAVTVLIQFIMATLVYYSNEYFFLLIIFEVLIVFPIILIVIAWIKKLGTGAKEISKGNLDYKVNGDLMLFEFKEFAENINNIGVGINVALEEKMKSEHLKTELITNVSHDIKTPLTSIINYVDLIKKENIENENVKEYLDVLERQSHKLKRLITDLVEASKLSTGNVETNLEVMDLAMIITQIQGEYYDALLEKGLQIHLRGTDSPVLVKADTRHLQRVFDNLINNIIKYAMENTRVYINLTNKDGYAVIDIKNISKYELNINQDELMERFVRGDSSRHTEGNGLGLSITQSLIKAQNGEMHIKIDGDLFKITIKFKTV